MSKRRFAEGGDTGRFDEDTYARARKFVQDAEQEAGEGRVGAVESAPRKPMPAKPPAAKPSAPRMGEDYGNEGYRKGRAEIPVEAAGPKAPASMGPQMGDVERNARNTMNAMAPSAARAASGIGRGVGALASSAREGWRAADAERKAKSAAEGAKIMADARSRAKSTEQTVSDLKNAFSKIGKKEEGYAKGGSVRGWGMARGARKAKMY